MSLIAISVENPASLLGAATPKGLGKSHIWFAVSHRCIYTHKHIRCELDLTVAHIEAVLRTNKIDMDPVGKTAV